MRKNLLGRIRKMARPRKDVNTNIEEQITKREKTVAKAKAKYDAEVAKLKDLYTKKDEIKKKELLKAVENSERSYGEIMEFLGGQAK